MQIYLYLLFKHRLVVSLQGASHCVFYFLYLSSGKVLLYALRSASGRGVNRTSCESVSLQSTLSLALGWPRGKERDCGTSLVVYLVFVFLLSFLSSSILSSWVIIPRPQTHSWSDGCCMGMHRIWSIKCCHSTHHSSIGVHSSHPLSLTSQFPVFSTSYTWIHSTLPVFIFEMPMVDFTLLLMFIQGQYGMEMDHS